MANPLAIFGAGGFARELLQVILDINDHAPSPVWQPLGFVVDPAYAGAQSLNGLPVWLGTEELDAKYPGAFWSVAVGNSAARRTIVQRLSAEGPRSYATLVHPRAWLGRHVSVGAGSVICAGCQITTDIQIGAQVHVNIGCTVGHDAVLDDFVTLNPGVNVSGNVNLGQGVEVGTNSVLIPHAHVGSWSLVGAGSVVTRSLPANVTAVGAPSRVIKTRPEGWHQAHK